MILPSRMSAPRTLAALVLGTCAQAEILRPVSVTSSTAPDVFPASNLIDGGGLSSTAFTERTLHTITHAVANGGLTSWVTAAHFPEYFDPGSPLPRPVLTFELEHPSEIDGFAYWGYVFNGGTQAQGNEAKTFIFSFLDPSGAPIGGTQSLTSPAPTNLGVNVCSLTPVANVKTVVVEITDNHHPLDGGDRVGLGEVRFLGRENPGAAIATESALGAGGENDHDPYFGDYSQTARLVQGNVVTAFTVRDEDLVAPSSPDGEGYGCYFRIYLPDGSSASSEPIAPYLDINPNGLGWQSRPLIAPLANGDFALAWSSSGGPGDVGPGTGFSANGDAYCRVFQADGTPRGGTVKVNENEPTGTNDDQAPVAIVSLGGGGFAIAWGDENDQTGNTDDYFVRAFDANGSPVAPSIQLGGVAHGGFFQDFGSLIALQNGGFAASWRTRDSGVAPSPDGDRYGAFFQTFTAGGAADSPVIFPYQDINPSGTGGQNSPLLAPLAGGLAVTWNSAYGPGDVGTGFNDNNGGDTYVRVFDFSGSAISSSTQVNDLTDPYEDSPLAIISLENGGFTICWRDDEGDPGPNEDDLFVRTYSALGVAAGPSVQLGDAIHEGLFQDFGDLIPLTDGGFAACWRTRDEDNGSGTSADGDGYGAFFQIFDADGSARSGIIVPYLDINPSGIGSQNQPAIAEVAGGIAVTWNSAYGPGDTGAGSNSTSGGDTYTRLFDFQGTAISSTQRAHDGDPTGTVDVQRPLTLTASRGSYAVVIEDANDNTGNTDDFFIRFFTTPADPLDADLNQDGLADFLDLMLLRDALAAGTGPPAYDLNGDTAIDAADLDAFLAITDLDVRTITSAADSGNGTLRRLIESAPAGSATYLPFAASMDGADLLLSSGQLAVPESSFIDASSLAQPPVLTAAPSSRHFQFQTSGLTILDSLVLTDGSEADGGSIMSDGTRLILHRCHLTNNTATNHGGAITTFGANSSLLLSRSTLSNNTAQNLGGGLIAFTGDIAIHNSTLAGNQASAASGFWVQGNGSLGLSHATLAANLGPSTTRSSVPTTIENSIITGSRQFSVTPTLLGENLLLTTGSPGLAPLGDYGGPTPTMIPLPGSPATDRISLPSFDADQRGFFRHGDADVGAAEFVPEIDYPTLWPTDFDGDGSPLGVEIALGTDPLLSDPGSDRRLAPPALDAGGISTLTFGWDSSAPFGTQWIISRSTDLITFDPIFRYDGDAVVLGSDTDTHFDITDGFISYGDTEAPTGKAFYRFEAEYLPPPPP